MNIKKATAIICFFLIVILSSFVSALSNDFTISGGKNVNVSRCYVTDEIISVANTGDVKADYAISFSGSGARFVSSAGPSEFSLAPGKKSNIKVSFSVPCSAKKKYNLNVNVADSFGSKKSLSRGIIVKTPMNIEITPVVYSKTINPCKNASYEFKLKNIGPFIEEYNIIFDKLFGDYTKVNFNEVTLDPNEEKSLYFIIGPDCSVYGNYSVPFSVKTSYTDIYAKTNVYLNIKRAYDYDFLIGNSYYVKEDNVTLDFIEHADSVYYLCRNSKDIIPVKIKNNGVIDNNYNVKIKAPPFVKLLNNMFSVNKSQEKIIELEIDSKGVEGNFSVGVNVLSELGDIEENKNITLIVDNCYEAGILERNVLSNYTDVKIPLTLENKGSKTGEYDISVEGGDWFGFDPGTVTVSGGESSTAYLSLKPTQETKRGGYTADITLSVKGTGVVYHDSLNVRLVSDNVIDKVFSNYIAPYLWYIIALIIALAVLAVLAVKKIKIKLVKIKEKSQRKKQREKEKKKKEAELKKIARKEAKKKRKKLSVKKKICIGLIVLFIASVAGFVFFYKDNLFIHEEGAASVNVSFIAEGFKENVLLPAKDFFVSGLNKTTNLTIAEPVVTEKANIAKNITEAHQLDIKPIFDKTTEFFRDYIYYMLAAAGILVVLIIFFNVMKKKAKEKIISAEFDNVSGDVILRNNNISVGEVIISLNKTLHNVKFMLRNIKRPTFISAGEAVYEYIEIKKENIDNNDLNRVNLRFKVKKSWLKANNVNKKDVVLKKYANTWVNVNTAYLSEDNKYCYYESILNGLSYFAITGKKRAEKPIAKEKPVVAAEKKIKAKKKINFKKFFWFFIILLLIAAVIALGYYYWDGFVSVFLKLKAVIGLYRWYMLSGFAILVLMSLILFLIRKFKIRFKFEKKKAEKPKPTAEEKPVVVEEKKVEKKKIKIKKPKHKKKIISGMLLILFIIFIVSGIVYFTYFKPGIFEGSDEEELIKEIEELIREEEIAEEEIIEELIREEEIEEIVEEEEGIIEEVFDDETDIIEEIEEIVEDTEESKIPGTTKSGEPEIIAEETIGIPDQEWDEDSDIMIDLKEYFYDPDNDTLSFSAKALDHITVSFEDGKATLTPKRNWYGTEEIVFIADDGKGGIVESNVVKLTVNDVEEEPLLTDKTINIVLTKIKEYTVIYFNYIVIGIVLLIILFLFVKYKEPILDFLEED